METLTTPKPRVKPILVNFPQRSEEWRQARLGNVTGSDAEKAMYNIGIQALNALIRDMLGVGSITKKVRESEGYKLLVGRDRFELFMEQGVEPPEPGPRIQYRRLKVAERLTGMDAELEDRFVTYDMKWGIISEQLAKTKYQLITENLVTEAPFMLHPEIRAGASPDGFVVERSTGLLGVIECKNLRSHNHLYDIIKANEIPEEYMTQIHMEIWISGRDFCDFIGYDSRLPEGLEMFVKRVWRDDSYIDNVLEPEVRRFLADCDKDEKYFRMKARKELVRRRTEGLILLPEMETANA